MELAGKDKVLLDLGPNLESWGQIYIPDHLQVPRRIGKVVNASPNTSLQVGDYVALHLRSAYDYKPLDKFYHINGKRLLLTDISRIQFKLKNSQKGKSLMKNPTQKINLDPYKDFTAMNKGIIVEIDSPEKTQKGIHILQKDIYERMANQETLTATVISVGRNANHGFAEEQIKVGSRVKSKIGLSGGPVIPDQNPSIWRTMGSNWQMILNEETGEWEPFGGICLVKGYYSDLYKVNGEYRRKDNDMIVPDSALPAPRVFEVVSKGPGWSKEFASKMWGMHNYDPLVDMPNVGECFISTNMYQHHSSEEMRQKLFNSAVIIEGEDGTEETLFMLDSMILDVRIEVNDIVDSMEPLQPKVPKSYYANALISGIGKN